MDQLHLRLPNSGEVSQHVQTRGRLRLGSGLRNGGRLELALCILPEKGPGPLGETVTQDDDGDVRMVSVSSDGRRGKAFSNNPQISGDGRYVAFQSSASNLVPGDANLAFDIFVHDTETRTTRRISVSSAGVTRSH